MNAYSGLIIESQKNQPRLDITGFLIFMFSQLGIDDKHRYLHSQVYVTANNHSKKESIARGFKNLLILCWKYM